MVYLTEQQIRHLVRQELISVLQDNQMIEEGMKDIFKQVLQSAGVVAALLYPSALGVDKIMVQQASAQQQQKIQIADQLSEEAQSDLVSMGATPDYAMRIVARAVDGANKEYFKQEQPAERYEDFLLNSLKKLKDKEVLSAIAGLDFMNEAERVGRSQLVRSAYQQGQSGTTSPILSLQFAFGSSLLNDIQEEKIDFNDIYSTEDGNAFVFDPMKLSYWEDKVIEGSELQKDLSDTLGKAVVPKALFDLAQAADIDNRIRQQIQ